MLSVFQSSLLRAVLRDEAGHFLGSAPTGSGKGYVVEEILRRTREKTLILVPLNALGRQTALRLRKRGLRAHFFDGVLPPDLQVLVTGPERLSNRALLDWCRGLRTVVIDECHCIEDWGSGFRPVFQDIYPFLKQVGPKRTLWMSGTLPRDHLVAFRKKSGLELELHGRFAVAENLDIEFLRLDPVDRFDRIHSLLRPQPDAPSNRIVFCNTRKETEGWHRLADQIGVECAYYHAGLSGEERSNLERRLEADPTSLLFATSAFGMGMDFQHIDWSIVTQAPYSLLSLIQALGRAGRGKRKGRGSVYWSESDFRWNAQSLDPSVAMRLRPLRAFLESGSAAERESFLSDYFV